MKQKQKKTRRQSHTHQSAKMMRVCGKGLMGQTPTDNEVMSEGGEEKAKSMFLNR